jgi:DNA invertase Pin-like site-specific DNA recombinase
VQNVAAMANAVILARASSDKQVIHGDTLEDQIQDCREYAQSQGWEVIKIFPLVESGRKQEREYFEEVLAYCKDRRNKVEFVVFKNISRFTRGGDSAYLLLKKDLEDNGVGIRDIYGTIRPKVNTMEQYGLKYDWSMYSPS